MPAVDGRQSNPMSTSQKRVHLEVFVSALIALQ
jgi:hypothetical protein